MRKFCLSLILFLFMMTSISNSSPSQSVYAEEYPPAEREILDDVIQTCLDWAKWCDENGYDEQLLRAFAIASRIDKSDPRVNAIEELTLSEVDRQPQPETNAEYEKRLKIFNEKVSDLFVRAYRKKGKTTAERHRDYLVWAIEAETSNKNAWRCATDDIKALQTDKRFDDLGIFVPRLLTIENTPDAVRKPVLDIELRTLTTASLQRKATAHKMWYELALPRDWSPDKTWPVLFGFEGAGCNFSAYHKGFVSNRGSLPLIIVTLHTFSSTNELEQKKYKYPPKVLADFKAKRIEFDSGGYEAVLRDLKLMYNAQDKVIVTGFSGGGNMTYYLTLHKPKELLASFPACPNFNPNLVKGSEPVGDARDLYIHIFTGASDPNKDLTHGKIRPGIEEQTDLAVNALTTAGFENVQRTMLDGVGHSACVRQVLEEISKLDIVRAEKR